MVVVTEPSYTPDQVRTAVGRVNALCMLPEGQYATPAISPQLRAQVISFVAGSSSSLTPQQILARFRNEALTIEPIIYEIQKSYTGFGTGRTCELADVCAAVSTVMSGASSKVRIEVDLMNDMLKDMYGLDVTVTKLRDMYSQNYPQQVEAIAQQLTQGETFVIGGGGMYDHGNMGLASVRYVRVKRGGKRMNE